MGVYFLDLMLDTQRIQALQRICRSYKPSIHVKFVSAELLFDSIDTARTFLSKAGCVLVKSDDGWEINTKDTILDTTALITNTNLLL